MVIARLKPDSSSTLNFEGATSTAITALRPFVQALRRYHRHDAIGIDNIPSTGPALLAFHHSLASYDVLLCCAVIGERFGRYPQALGDNNLFAIPGLRESVTASGVLPASHENGERLLNAGKLVVVAPGGTREALRPSTETRSIRWDRRKGFVRLALSCDVPIVPIACPAADDLYTVYENRLTKIIYRGFRFPLPIIRGWGPTLVPRPIQLTHYVGEPVLPCRDESLSFDERVDATHTLVLSRMNELLRR